MLVLTRKTDERIAIGENIVVSVLEISKGSVKLGIEAPKTVSIFRYEILERIREENLKSAQGTFDDVENAVSLWRQRGHKE